MKDRNFLLNFNPVMAVDKLSMAFGLVILATLGQAIEYSESKGKAVNFDPATEGKDFWMKTRKEELLKYLGVERSCGMAKNVIIFIGDGMGQPIVAASRIYKGQLEKKPGEETMLTFEKFPYSGQIRTYCTDKQVPDSACTATAIFTGVAGLYYTVGIDGHGKAKDCDATMATEKNFPTSWMTHAQKAGKKTGIITTTRITHATPASNYAHSPFRNWESDVDMPANASKCKDIARQMVEDEPGKSIDVIMGGGAGNFLPKCKDGRRKDGKDLIEEWKKNNADNDVTHEYVTTEEELQEALKKKPERLLGFFNSNHMKFEADKSECNETEPHIANMTEAAIKLLDNPEGYVLVVEGGRIDHGLHDANAKRAIIDLLAFEKAVQKAVDMTDPKETLIIVGADHSHTLAMNGYPARGNPILGIADVQKDYGLPYTTLMFTNGMGYKYDWNGTHVLWNNVSGVDTEDLDYKQQCAIYKPEHDETHGGEDVGYWATGPWAHLISGSHHLAYISHMAQFAACLGEYSGSCKKTKRRSRSLSSKDRRTDSMLHRMRQYRC